MGDYYNQGRFPLSESVGSLRVQHNCALFCNVIVWSNELSCVQLLVWRFEGTNVLAWWSHRPREEEERNGGKHGAPMEERKVIYAGPWLNQLHASCCNNLQQQVAVQWSEYFFDHQAITHSNRATEKHGHAYPCMYAQSYWAEKWEEKVKSVNVF